MVSQDELNDIIEDVSFEGSYTKFYEMLQESLENWSDKRIEGMKSTLIFDSPTKIEEIEKYDKMKILHEYSLLP
jgi:hypothetical protein